MKLKRKNSPLTAVVIIVLVIACCVWLFLGRIDHIEDTNGADDFSLQTITEENIINLDFGATGGPAISRGNAWNEGVEFSADKYTGVTEILYDDFFGTSDFEVSLSSFSVTGGNFQMVVVYNGEIVATLEPGSTVEYRLEDVSGYISLRIAGESASFSFTMSEYDYDRHTHSD